LQKKDESAAANSQAGGAECTKEGPQFTVRKCAIGGLDAGGTGDVSIVDYRQSHNVKT
jgi:hypothetical protein